LGSKAQNGEEKKTGGGASDKASAGRLREGDVRGVVVALQGKKKAIPSGRWWGEAAPRRARQSKQSFKKRGRDTGKTKSLKKK